MSDHKCHQMAAKRNKGGASFGILFFHKQEIRKSLEMKRRLPSRELLVCRSSAARLEPVTQRMQPRECSRESTIERVQLKVTQKWPRETNCQRVPLDCLEVNEINCVRAD